MKKRRCARCGVAINNKTHSPHQISRHHILPKKRYGDSKEVTIYCRKCHEQLHEVLDRMENSRKMTMYDYHIADINFKEGV